MNDGAIIPLTPLSNRKQKRQFKREALKIAGVLEEINAGFVWHIFNADGGTYNEIYLHYLKQWNATVDELAKNKKFVHCGIDRLFFEREYKPMIYIK